MTDPVIRPGNGLMLVALQTAEGVAASPSALTDVVPCETDSVSYNGPYKANPADEANGSFAAAAPLVVGQPSTISFKSRIKGAGAGVAYSATVKPPLHAPLSACGWLGLFTAAIAATALSAGTNKTATLANPFAATAQLYRGQPLILAGAPAAGRFSPVTDYTGGVATLSDQFGSALSAANSASLPANWSYAPTSPVDSGSRTAMHPAATVVWYEDGRLHTWTDCRGTVDFDGNAGQPGFATFSFTGVYGGEQDVAMPTNAVYPGQSAPLLVQGVGGVQPAFQVNRRGLAISKWSLKNNGQVETPDDPNTPLGFGPGQLADRMYQLEIDPLLTQVATRNAIADIAAFSQYPAALVFGQTAGNRASLTLPVIQPTDTAPTMRGKLRAETLHYQALSLIRDAAGRDGDAILTFS